MSYFTKLRSLEQNDIFLNLLYSLYFVAFVYVFSRDYKWTLDDISVISTTYYTSNKSGYPPNTMAMLYNAQRKLFLERPFLCVSKNKTNVITSLATVKYAFDPIKVCKWTVYLLTCPVAQNLVSFGLSDTKRSYSPVIIPHRVAVKKPMGVVACFSPLFYNERWQLIIPTLEIYRQLGVDLQNYYIQSMLSEIFDFLKIYEKLGFAHIETWNQLEIDKERLSALGYDPNSELEWRNQPTAHSDCFLKYKQSADFIIISDIDDILFPQLGKTYLEEFQKLTSSFSNVAMFTYNRYNTEIVSSRNNENFSLSSLIQSAKISNQWEDGKYVIRPKHAETVWLHWPGNVEKGYKLYTVDDSLNIMIHFRNWTFVDHKSDRFSKPQKSFPLFKNQIGDFIQRKNTSRLERNFQLFLEKHAQEEFDRLPRSIRYYPLIEQCYDRIFYGRSKIPESCPGPLRCDLPQVKGLKCAIAKRKYGHETMNTKIKFHFPITDGEFVVSQNGCHM